jgi:acyl-CoA thioesterase I
MLMFAIKKCKLYLLTLLSFSFLVCHAKSSDVSSQPIHNSVIRIINIGDSITEGGLVGRDEYTYRLPLYRLLKKHSIPVDFVGVHQAGISKNFKWPTDFDLDHEGFYGKTTTQIAEQLKNDLEKLASPDIAIIDLGSNDPNSNIEKTTIAPLKEIIHNLRAKNPNIKIILVQIPGIVQNLATHYEVWLIAHKLSTEESPIVTAPLYLIWDTKKDTFDGAHPNIKGQNKMAYLLYPKIISLLSMARN